MWEFGPESRASCMTACMREPHGCIRTHHEGIIFCSARARDNHMFLCSLLSNQHSFCLPTATVA